MDLINSKHLDLRLWKWSFHCSAAEFSGKLHLQVHSLVQCTCAVCCGAGGRHSLKLLQVWAWAVLGQHWPWSWGPPGSQGRQGHLQRLGGERREGTALLHGVWRRNKTNWGRGVTVLTQKVSNCYIYIWVQSLNCSWSRQIYIPSKHCCILFPSSFLPAAINLDALVDINIQSLKNFSKLSMPWIKSHGLCFAWDD